MSATQIRFDWRIERAAAVLKTGEAFDPRQYAELFDLDFDETIELFYEAARHAGVRFIWGPPAPRLPLH